MKIGDLVKFRDGCKPGWYHRLHPRVFLVEYASGTFIALHGHREHGLTAKQNFILVREAK